MEIPQLQSFDGTTDDLLCDRDHAWGYVGFRVLHSLVQGTINVVRYRLPLFLLASLCLLGLTVHAAARMAHDCGII